MELPGSGDVKDKFKELNVVAMEADVDHSEGVWDFLHKFGRSNIPVNLMYPADPSKPPIILSEVLTQSIMLEALDMASGTQG